MGKDNPIKIAVVDDSELSRQSIVEILESAGHQVVGNFSTGEEALRQYKACGADVFLVDVVMPDISGIEVAKEITGKSMGSSIVMMSSLNSEHIVIESISNGATDFLQKPFEAQTLLDSVEKAYANLR